MSDGAVRLKRLSWLCRRGMKELDLLLEAFVHRESEALSHGKFPQFEAFLATEDDVLWDWFQGRSQPEDAAMQFILERIRQ